MLFVKTYRSITRIACVDVSLQRNGGFEEVNHRFPIGEPELQVWESD